MPTAESVRRDFRAEFGSGAASVARAPGRVNLIGDHTDYNQGLALPFALEQAAYVAATPRRDPALHIVSAQAGRWEGTDLRAADDWAAYVAGVVWALREDGVPVPGFDLYVDSSVPLGAGLSSSAALGCATALAVAGDLDRDRLVAACIRAETEVAGAPTGGMDQTIAMHARSRHALLIDFADGARRQVELDPAAAGLVLLVVDTRVRHELADGSYGDRRTECSAAAAGLGVSLRHARLDGLDRLVVPVLRRRARHAVTENLRVEHTVVALRAGRWSEVGALMSASHASLRDDFEVSCTELDLAVGTALEAGALGARLTGGGFGGSVIALVPQERARAMRMAIDTAFVAAGFAAPAYLSAVPSGPAAVER